MGAEELAQRFLEVVSRRTGEFEVHASEVAEQYAATADDRGVVPWVYAKAEVCPWMSQLEEGLLVRLPRSVEALYGHYRFLPFAIDSLQLMRNTGLPGAFELLSYVDSDPHMSPLLLRERLVPFARLDTGSYDPVCLDARRTADNREYALVVVDHEQALTGSRIVIRRTVAPSFLAFMSRVT
jgi:hypothetical protein